MKEVQAAHSWRRVGSEWAGKHAFSRLNVQEACGFEGSQVELHGGACIVAGVNSGGKSRLIRSVLGEFVESSTSFTTVTWNGDRPTAAVFVDFFELLIREANLFQIADLGDLVASSGFTPLSPKKLRNVNWILGREYTSVQFAEVENPNVNLIDSDVGAFRSEVVPYFQITHKSGEKFRSEDLSRGELSALTLSWVLDSLESGSLYLFDEPDLMLSPHSSERAISLLINRVNELKSPAFIATHSYHTLASVPETLLLHVNVGANGYSLASRPDDAALWKTLKVAAPVKAAFVVEDEAAKGLLRALLSEVSPRHSDVSAIWIAGDATRVIKAGKFPRSKGQNIEIWGVLDGNEEDPDPKDNIFKLPGGMSPEQGALMVLREHPEALGVDRDRADELVSWQLGVDPHDGARAVAAHLGLEPLTFIVIAWRWWLKEVERGRRELEKFKRFVVDNVKIQNEP